MNIQTTIFDSIRTMSPNKKYLNDKLILETSKFEYLEVLNKFKYYKNERNFTFWYKCIQFINQKFPVMRATLRLGDNSIDNAYDELNNLFILYTHKRDQRIRMGIIIVKIIIPDELNLLIKDFIK